MRPIYTIENLHAYAQSKGGVCLSTEYTGACVRYSWQCSLGHRWEGVWYPMTTKKSWCRLCVPQRQLAYTIEKLQEYAKSRGGACLSTEYLGSSSLYEWKCGNFDHPSFKAAWNSMQFYGSWCRKCSGAEKLTIADMHELALSKGGKFLSSEYIDSQTKHKWECDKGHQWEARPDSVKNRGDWCPECANFNRRGFEIADLYKWAKDKGGQCLSSSFKSSADKYEWECHLGHRWKAIWRNIYYNGYWCQRCRNLADQKYIIEDLHNHAKNKNGLCMDSEYINGNHYYTWKCKNVKHKTWKASWFNVERGTWCPNCTQSRSKPEIAIYDFLKHFYPTVQPNVKGLLKSKRLELDFHF